MNSLNGLFESPKRAARPLRVLVFALSKRGKSHFVYTATEVGPLYWIDTERGSEFYDSSNGHGFQVRFDRDPYIAIQAIEAANKMALNGGPRPIVAIDSFSSIWFEQQEVAERLSRGGKKQSDSDRASFRSWAVAKKPLKRLYELFHASQCHIIITGREKDDYLVAGGGEPKKIGVKPDVERNLEYSLDYTLHMGVDELPMGKPPTPENFWARVVGTRAVSSEGGLKIGTVLKNPRFSDLLPSAMLDGEPPQEIGSSVDEQVNRELTAPQNWPEFIRRAEEITERTPDELKAMLKEKFGTFDGSMWAEYWDYISREHSG